MTTENSLLAERFRVALDLFKAGKAIMRQNLRRRDPRASDAEIERRLAEWLRGRPEHEEARGLRLRAGGSRD